MRTRDIRTNQADVGCDVCGRTLLRGEHADPFLAGGERRAVCDLCTARAQHEGWIRESGAEEPALRQPRHDGRGRGLLERLRPRREAPEPAPAAEPPPPDEPAPVPAAPVVRERVAEPPRRPRHVRAVPTNAEQKMQRALDVFNGSQQVRTVGGVARSLGPPDVCVRTRTDQPALVTITVVWELSWYRFEIDLADERGGVRRDAQGDEVSELAAHERVVNAAADARGALHLS